MKQENIKEKQNQQKAEKNISNINLQIEDCYYVDPKKEDIKTIEGYIFFDWNLWLWNKPKWICFGT